MKKEKSDVVSAVASAVVQSDLENQLSSKVKVNKNVGAGDGGHKEEVVKTSKVSIKKVRLTPGKVLSMVVGNGKRAKSQAEGAAKKKPGKKKKHKREVKEAIFGPGDFRKKIKKRGSSSDEEEEVKQKKPKRRRRKEPEPPKEEVKPKEPTPPPPKEPTPPPPKDPTLPPSKEATPALEEKQEEPEVVEEKEPEPVAVSPPPSPPPLVVEASPHEDTNGPPTDTDEEVLSESGYFGSHSMDSNRAKSQFGSLCCPTAEKYKGSLKARLFWLLLLFYRGPVRHTAGHILYALPYAHFILGPTFDSVLIEYVSLLLEVANSYIMHTFPELYSEKVEGTDGDDGKG